MNRFLIDRHLTSDFVIAKNFINEFELKKGYTYKDLKGIAGKLGVDIKSSEISEHSSVRTKKEALLRKLIDVYTGQKSDEKKIENTGYIINYLLKISIVGEIVTKAFCVIAILSFLIVCLDLFNYPEKCLS